MPSEERLVMTVSRVRQNIAALFCVIAIVGCSGATSRAAQTSHQHDRGATPDPAAIARAKADSIRLPYTEADVHFMSAMIGHHAQAIVMASWAPTHGASAAVRRLAERIIGSQHDEIATMQRWLRDRLKPVPEARAGHMKMMMNGVEHEMLMPGMLTDAQMKQLDQARGPEFDKLFVTFMIQHHRGAVSMVKDLFNSYGAGQDETVFKFASDVNVDQVTEIERMEKMLVALTLGVESP
jgi:uncharacterized protein (DUF305 family)